MMSNQSYAVLQSLGTIAGVGVVGYYMKQMMINGDLAEFKEDSLKGNRLIFLSLFYVLSSF